MRHARIGSWLVSQTASMVRVILGLLIFVGYVGVASAGAAPGESSDYIIGPGDSFQVFVWHNPDLSATVPVRPDGRISIPLVEDIECAGKTPTQLARDIEERLKKFIQDPTVTIIMA